MRDTRNRNRRMWSEKQVAAKIATARTVERATVERQVKELNKYKKCMASIEIIVFICLITIFNLCMYITVVHPNYRIEALIVAFIGAPALVAAVYRKHKEAHDLYQRLLRY